MDETLLTLERIINLHNSMDGSYFFNPPSIAAGRRSFEDKHSLTSTFEYNGDTYTVEQKTRCSTRNVYYHVNYYKNGEKIHADIRLVKKIFKALSHKTA